MGVGVSELAEPRGGGPARHPVAGPAGSQVEGAVTELARELVRLTRGTQAMRTHLAAHGPQPMDWSTYVLLLHLVREGPQRSSALAEAVHVDPSTVSRQVAQLVRLGLAERRADPGDGRAALLVASSTGERLWAAVQERRNRAIGVLVADWPSGDVDRLTELLSRLNDGFTARRTDVLDAMTGEAPPHHPAQLQETS